MQTLHIRLLGSFHILYGEAPVPRADSPRLQSLLASCYDDWVLTQRERLCQAFARAVQRLIELLESPRHYPAAIREAQRLLRHGPLQEATCRRLMHLDEIMSPDSAEHEKRFAPMWLAVFPDVQFAVEEMIAEGDKVVSRVTFRGTHQAEYRGIPATGRPVEVKAVWIHRLAGGRIVEGKQWGFVDWLGLLQQLGATIAPPASDQGSGNSLA